MEDNKVAVAASPAIYRAIAGVIADVGAVSKDKVNKQQGFKFRSIDDVYNALHPALAKNKVFIVPKILNRTSSVIGKTKNGTDMVKVECEIEFTFYGEDGSSVAAVIVGEGLDTGDKATNKAMAIAYKYACFQVFCIPTEDMTDPDAECPEEELDKSNNKKSGKSNSNTQNKTAEKRQDKSAEKKPEKSADKISDSESEDTTITEAMLNTIRSVQERTGVTDQLILGRKAVKAKRIEDMTVSEFKYIMGIFEKTGDLKGAQQSE